MMLAPASMRACAQSGEECQAALWIGATRWPLANLAEVSGEAPAWSKASTFSAFPSCEDKDAKKIGEIWVGNVKFRVGRSFCLFSPGSRWMLIHPPFYAQPSNRYCSLIPVWAHEASPLVWGTICSQEQCGEEASLNEQFWWFGARGCRCILHQRLAGSDSVLVGKRDENWIICSN